jgi:hypothetical protein
MMKKALTLLLIITEPFILLLIIYTFWFHAPPIRDQWIWLLWFAVPIFWLRHRIQHRLWTRTPLDDLLIVFILLTALNFVAAPLARSNYIVLLCRPLLGIWIYIYFCEHAFTWRTLQWLVIVSVGMSLVLGFISLTTTAWHLDKSGDLAFIINALPHFDWRSLDGTFRMPFFRDEILFPPISEMGLSFNPNEVGGALAFIIPVMAGLALGNPRDDGNPVQKRVWTGIRIGAAIALGIALLSLFVGQSRFAIGGVILSLIIVVLLVKNRIWKIAALSIVGVLVLLQIALLLNVFTPAVDTSDTAGLSSRDQRTFTNRFDLWGSAVRMMFDYPLTGVGMSMYRTAVSQEAYQIEYYVQRGTVPPHAHNEWFQIGADLGVPGFLMFLTMQAVVLWMLWKGWRSSHPHGQIVAVAVFGGLLAHSIYGIGDAITLWDRFSFVLWWLVGLAGAQYVLVIQDDGTMADNTVPATSTLTVAE